jgi:hypothetical protein
MVRPLIPLAFLASTSLALADAPIPQYDDWCHDVVQHELEMGHTDAAAAKETLAQCRASEKKKLAFLKSNWVTYSEKVRSICVSMNTSGKAQSYEVLITCLKIYKEMEAEGALH